MYRRSSKSRMRSGTRRGVSKWSRRKDRYIGRLYSEFGKVPSDSGIFWSTGELREFAGEKYWALLGHTGKREGLPRAGRAPPQGLVRIGLGGGAAPLPCFLLLLHGRTPSWTRKGGILLPLGRAIERAGPPLLHSFIYGGRGHPIDTQVDLRDRSLAVCGAPLHDITPRSYCSGA